MTKEIVSDFSRAIKTKLSLHPSIYIVCLAAREKGIIYGAWIEADKSLEALKFAIEQVLDKSSVHNSEAWIMTKYEDFGDSRLSQFASLETIHHFASFFAEYGRLGTALLKHLDNPDDDHSAIEEARELLENSYYGAFPNKMDFIQSELIRTKIPLPKKAYDYLDLEAHWFKYNHFALTIDDAVHVFDCN